MKKYFLVSFSKMNYFLFFSPFIYINYIYIYYVKLYIYILNRAHARVCVHVNAKFVKMNMMNI